MISHTCRQSTSRAGFVLALATSILALSRSADARAAVRLGPGKPQGGGASAPESRPSVDELMSKIEAKYKQSDKRYETLADDIEKQVRKALKSTVWLSAEEAGGPRAFDEHPYILEVEQLSKAARSEAARAAAKKEIGRDALVAKFPWTPRLEFDLGLDLGSDRPVPANEKGFVAMGRASDPVRGFPELSTNIYLFGLHEIVSWRTGVKAGKKLAFEGRDPKKPPVMETTLPDWEKIRVFLEGSLPEVPLFAIPWLEHTIHARLAERRRAPAGELARMDEMLAFLDSKWDGFSFQVPYSKDRLVVVYPVHELVTDRKGFFYGFPHSEEMARVGDLPLISTQCYMQYAQAFLGQKLGSGDFIGNSAAGSAAGASFQADSGYLSRYKTLIDLIVRAVLSPHLRYPAYLALYDYPKGKMPTERKIDPAFDVARKHALLAWAYSGRDPVKLADFLFDEVLDKEANRFPNNVGLAAVFMTAVRENEAVMTKAVAARIAEERAKAPGSGEKGPVPSDDEREFSPQPIYLDSKGEPAADFLIESFEELNGRVAQLIQDTAYAIVRKEIAK
jgi:hypothetical protein